ncbi:MAG: undecaprenyl-diphosphate phosphatase [Halobacteriota archaeon]
MDISQLIQAIVLGIVQGVTEWLPISSKAMVSLVMIKFFNADVTLSEAVYYAIWLHLGTLFAVILFYRVQVVQIVRNLPHYFSNVRSPSAYNRLTTFLIIATFFTGLIGAPLIVFGLDKIHITGSIAFVFIGVLLIVTGIFQKLARRTVSANKSMSIKDALLVGVIQGFAALPGLSRSGLTVSTLLLRRYAPTDALNLSFLLYIPAVIGAEIGLQILKGGIYYNAYALVAVVVAFVFGLLTINVLLKIAERVDFSYFAIFIGVLCMLAIFVPI